MLMRLVSVVCIMCAAAIPATADVADYCAAYARDHADQGPREKRIWQKRYDNALNTCGEQFSLQEPATVAKKPQKPVVKKVVEKPKPVAKSVAKPEPQPEPAVTEPKKVATLPKLKTGSPEWIKYCKSKYVSFDEAKGTYLSKTGVERKCLVTAD